MIRLIENPENISYELLKKKLLRKTDAVLFKRLRNRIRFLPIL